MVENNDHEDDSKKTGIEEILMERERLEKLLQDQYKKDVTILFCDICDYSRYVDEHGDVRGRTLLIKHNQIVLPLIEAHNGKVAELIGDAVMASFSEPIDAVLAAVAIHKDLANFNADKTDADAIHVKIGINSGEVLVDEQAKFQSLTGDVAIVAFRIQGHAGKDQILISKDLYKRVCGNEDILCRYHGSLRVKGKAEPQDLYRILWRDEEIVSEAAPQVRVLHAPGSKPGKKIPRILHIEANLAGDNLRLSVHEGAKGEAITIRNYEDIQAPLDLIDSRCLELVDTLNKTNQRGRITEDILLKLRNIGQILYDDIFSIRIKETLKKTNAEYLCLNLGERLVHIPWELLNDGTQFLCQRFAMGRIVKTRQSILANWSRELGRPLNVLLLADPTGDLKGAYAEGIQIRDYLDHHRDYFNVAFRSDHVRADSLRQKMRNFDIVHFAGHADYHPDNPDESGWRLSEVNLKTKDIRKMAGTSAMPALVFSNSCQSARTEEWALAKDFQDDIFGLANAFLLSGVRHYVGTFWEIIDEPGRRFALEFYKALVAGNAIGDAIRQGRKALIKEYGEETIVWASYLLYGDPTYNYMEQIWMKDHEEKSQRDPQFEAPGTVRTREDIIDFAEKQITKPSRKWLIVAALTVLIGIFVVWGYPGFLRRGPSDLESTALAHFKAGNYSDAFSICKVLQQKYPDRALSHVIMGNMQLEAGKREKAKFFYQNALAAPNGSKVEQAQALIRLGRIASLEGNPKQALAFYVRAAEVAPDNAQAYISQAMILVDDRKYADALKLFEKAQNLSADTRSIDAIIYEIRQRAEMVENREKQARIDRLVHELLERFETTSEQQPADEWTSTPLTVWIMDFVSEGYSLNEGENKIVRSVISGRLIEYDRVRVVERALIDKLMQELKLGTSKLIDRRTALSLGKILAAKAIVSGQLIYQGLQTRISLRLIEAETGEVKAALDEVFERRESIAIPAAKISDDLILKLIAVYPLRGKILKIEGNQILVNIGRQHGVQRDQRFTVVGTGVALTISSVDSERSTALIPENAAALTVGQRIELN
jgi:class 3 adenylate cyclase/CHAT domain-containing protein/Tfp pilus assembly protein PilF